MERDTKILETIRREFSQRAGRRVSQRLRELAVLALHKGYTASEIARAAGVSSPSIANWKRISDEQTIGAAERRSALPVELKVIEERAPLDQPVEETRSMARILLRSGAMVEVVASALDPNWLIALNGVAP